MSHNVIYLVGCNDDTDDAVESKIEEADAPLFMKTKPKSAAAPARARFGLAKLSVGDPRAPRQVVQHVVQVPRTQHRCSHPYCGYTVHPDARMGSYCCWRCSEHDAGKFKRHKHGAQCQRIEAGDEAPMMFKTLALHTDDGPL